MIVSIALIGAWCASAVVLTSASVAVTFRARDILVSTAICDADVARTLQQPGRAGPGDAGVMYSE